MYVPILLGIFLVGAFIPTYLGDTFFKEASIWDGFPSHEIQAVSTDS